MVVVGVLTSISGYGRECDHFWSKNDEGYVTWLVGSVVEGWRGARSKLLVAQRATDTSTLHSAHSSASGQPAKKIHRLKSSDGTALEYLLGHGCFLARLHPMSTE